jgi:hypothetical protein
LLYLNGHDFYCSAEEPAVVFAVFVPVEELADVVSVPVVELVVAVAFAEEPAVVFAVFVPVEEFAVVVSVPVVEPAAVAVVFAEEPVVAVFVVSVPVVELVVAVVFVEMPAVVAVSFAEAPAVAALVFAVFADFVSVRVQTGSVLPVGFDDSRHFVAGFGQLPVLFVG